MGSAIHVVGPFSHKQTSTHINNFYLRSRDGSRGISTPQSSSWFAGVQIKITETKRKPNMKQFEDKELVLIAQIIDVASQKGMFKAPDLKIIGDLFQKITGQLPKPPKEEPKTDEQK